MSNTAVSVIVPVYNVAPFISQCLDSLARQSLANMEIIIVDDGSTDATAELVASTVGQGRSIRVISQENRGLSAARNAGMDIARGEFIGFVDGDDWVDERMFESLYSVAVDTRADIVICNGRLVDHETGESRHIQDDHVWAELKSRHENLLLSPSLEPDLFKLDTSVCKRLYRREFLETLNFRFSEGKIFEDIPAHFRMLLNTETVAMIDREFYFYRTNRPDRITARKDRTLLQVFEVMQEVIDDLYRHEADLAVWENFIWFQAWVLKWLRNQIDGRYLEEFMNQSSILAANFKDEPVLRFLEKFKGDRQNVIFVLEQTSQAKLWKKNQKSLLRLNEVHSSKSWKITAPLRWLLDVFNNLRPPYRQRDD